MIIFLPVFSSSRRPFFSGPYLGSFQPYIDIKLFQLFIYFLNTENKFSLYFALNMTRNVFTQIYKENFIFYKNCFVPRKYENILIILPNYYSMKKLNYYHLKIVFFIFFFNLKKIHSFNMIVQGK